MGLLAVLLAGTSIDPAQTNGEASDLLPRTRTGIQTDGRAMASQSAKDEPSTPPSDGNEVDAELLAALARAQAVQQDWSRLFIDFPQPPNARTDFRRRLLPFLAFQSSMLERVSDPRERLACVGAYLSYVDSITKLVRVPLAAVWDEMVELSTPIERHESEAVERYCVELRAREQDLRRRWHGAERTLMNAVEPFIGSDGAETLERWQCEWVLNETVLSPMSQPSQIDLEQFFAVIAAGSSDTALVAACQEHLRGHRLEIARLMKPRIELLWDASCAEMRQPVHFVGETMFVGEDAETPVYRDARARMAQLDRSCFEAMRNAVNKVASSASVERSAAMRDAFATLAAPPVYPDPTDLAAFESSLRQLLGPAFEGDQPLQQLLADTHARRRVLCERMSDAYLEWCWDIIRTGSSTDWIRYCDELLARGRDRIALAQQTIQGVRNRLDQAPHQEALMTLCDDLDAALAAPEPVVPYGGMQLTLDFVSPDDATTQLLRQIEEQRREHAERRAKIAEKEALIEGKRALDASRLRRITK